MNASAPNSDEVQLLREEIVHLRTQIAWLKKQLFGPGKKRNARPGPVAPDSWRTRKNRRRETTRRDDHVRTGQRSGRTAPIARGKLCAPAGQRDRRDRTGRGAEKIGEERTFEVEVTPPQLYKREIVRPKYRHRLDRARAPLVAPAPARPVAGGYASAGLLAWVLIAKYCDHLPLYRQEKMLARWGAKISSQTMTDWVRISAEWLEPLYKRMQHDLLAGGYVQADETPIPCNDPDEKRGGTTQGWLWAVSKPGGDVVFDWRLTRQHGELTSLLKDYCGILQSDGYGAVRREVAQVDVQYA